MPSMLLSLCVAVVFVCGYVADVKSAGNDWATVKPITKQEAESLGLTTGKEFHARFTDEYGEEALLPQIGGFFQLICTYINEKSNSKKVDVAIQRSLEQTIRMRQSKARKPIAFKDKNDYGVTHDPEKDADLFTLPIDDEFIKYNYQCGRAAVLDKDKPAHVGFGTQYKPRMATLCSAAKSKECTEPQKCYLYKQGFRVGWKSECKGPPGTGEVTAMCQSEQQYACVGGAKAAETYCELYFGNKLGNLSGIVTDQTTQCPGKVTLNDKPITPYEVVVLEDLTKTITLKPSAAPIPAPTTSTTEPTTTESTTAVTNPKPPPYFRQVDPSKVDCKISEPMDMLVKPGNQSKTPPKEPVACTLNALTLDPRSTDQAAAAGVFVRRLYLNGIPVDVLFYQNAAAGGAAAASVGTAKLEDPKDKDGNTVTDHNKACGAIKIKCSLQTTKSNLTPDPKVTATTTSAIVSMPTAGPTVSVTLNPGDTVTCNCKVDVKYTKNTLQLKLPPIDAVTPTVLKCPPTTPTPTTPTTPTQPITEGGSRNTTKQDEHLIGGGDSSSEESSTGGIAMIIGIVGGVLVVLLLLLLVICCCIRKRKRAAAGAAGKGKEKAKKDKSKDKNSKNKGILVASKDAKAKTEKSLEKTMDEDIKSKSKVDDKAKAKSALTSQSEEKSGKSERSKVAKSEAKSERSAQKSAQKSAPKSQRSQKSASRKSQKSKADKSNKSDRSKVKSSKRSM